MKRLKYYIASGFENQKAHNQLRDRLRGSSLDITYDWTLYGRAHTGGLERMEEVTNLEIGGVLTADIVFVLMPGGRGTHVEFGAALATNKNIIVIGDEDYLDKEKTCVFYYHPNVTRVHSQLHAVNTALGYLE